MALRLVFMGTPDFAVPTLLEIVGAGHEVAAVYTRAPQPAGRGMPERQSPIAREAERFGIPVLTPKTLRPPPYPPPHAGEGSLIFPPPQAGEGRVGAGGGHAGLQRERHRALHRRAQRAIIAAGGSQFDA